jgi:hypothetical protein
MGLERGPLSLKSAIEELLGIKSSGSGLENREYDLKNPSRWPRDTLYPQKLSLTSPTNGGRSVGIVRSRTQATKFCFSLCFAGEVSVASTARIFYISKFYLQPPQTTLATTHYILQETFQIHDLIELVRYEIENVYMRVYT